VSPAEVSLQEHLSMLVGELDKRISQRFDAQEKSIAMALAAANETKSTRILTLSLSLSLVASIALIVVTWLARTH